MINVCPRCGSARLRRYWSARVYRCKDCGAEFEQPAKLDKVDWNTVMLCASAWLVGLAVLIVSFASATATAMSPNIYLYAPGEQRERVKLTVKGAITARIPFRPGARSVVWRDLTLKDGKILDRGKQYDYLFYESQNVVPKHGGAGWVLERKGGRMTLDGEPVDRESLAAVFAGILERYGLFRSEIRDFTDQMLGPDMRMFSGNADAAYAIYPVPQEELDRIFAIETELDYQERIRVQFLVKGVPDGTGLERPEFPEVVRSQWAMHEWGVITG